jgi:ribosome-associated translation inhibitor RaiA
MGPNREDVAMTGPAREIDVQVHADHQIPAADRDYARHKVTQAIRRTRRPVLYVRVDLHQDHNPSQTRPAQAKALVDLNGTPVEAHGSAPTLHEAIDLLEDRLVHRLEHARVGRAPRR